MRAKKKKSSLTYFQGLSLHIFLHVLVSGGWACTPVPDLYVAWSVDINTFYKHDLHVKTDKLATMSLGGYMSRVYVYVFVFSCFILTLLLSERFRDVTIHSLITIYIPIPNISLNKEILLSDEQMEVIRIISTFITTKNLLFA